MREEIYRAIGAHVLWKSWLKEAIDSGTSELTVADVGSDNKCEFGKWLYGVVVDPTPESRAFHENVRNLHGEFHQEVARILGHALAGDRENAMKAIAPGTTYFDRSARLSAEMLRWARTLP